MNPGTVIDIGPDPVAQFFWSGSAHAYYGSLATALICAGVLVGVLSEKWLIAGVAFSAGVFVDLWAHGYAH